MVSKGFLKDKKQNSIPTYCQNKKKLEEVNCHQSTMSTLHNFNLQIRRRYTVEAPKGYGRFSNSALQNSAFRLSLIQLTHMNPNLLHPVQNLLPLKFSGCLQVSCHSFPLLSSLLTGFLPFKPGFRFVVSPWA